MIELIFVDEMYLLNKIVLTDVVLLLYRYKLLKLKSQYWRIAERCEYNTSSWNK